MRRTAIRDSDHGAVRAVEADRSIMPCDNVISYGLVKQTNIEHCTVHHALRMPRGANRAAVYVCAPIARPPGRSRSIHSRSNTLRLVGGTGPSSPSPSHGRAAPENPLARTSRKSVDAVDADRDRLTKRATLARLCRPSSVSADARLSSVHARAVGSSHASPGAPCRPSNRARQVVDDIAIAGPRVPDRGQAVIAGRFRRARATGPKGEVANDGRGDWRPAWRIFPLATSSASGVRCGLSAARGHLPDYGTPDIFKCAGAQLKFHQTHRRHARALAQHLAQRQRANTAEHAVEPLQFLQHPRPRFGKPGVIDLHRRPVDAARATDDAGDDFIHPLPFARGLQLLRFRAVLGLGAIIVAGRCRAPLALGAGGGAVPCRRSESAGRVAPKKSRSSPPANVPWGAAAATARTTSRRRFDPRAEIGLLAAHKASRSHPGGGLATGWKSANLSVGPRNPDRDIAASCLVSMPTRLASGGSRLKCAAHWRALDLAIMAGRVAPCPEGKPLKALPPVSRLVSSSRLPARCRRRP